MERPVERSGELVHRIGGTLIGVPTMKARVQVTIDEELADALAAIDPAPASRSRLVRDLAIRGADAIRADRACAQEAVAHLVAIADGAQPHDFAAVSELLSGRGDRLP
ncbi:MAG TPA: hypothetical protein VN635_03590 [Conexibacter sp.]|nr:hypothetical protein [Conexibacter sp.]